MKKTNVIPLNEIKAGDIQKINDYLEDAISLLAGQMLEATNGVVTGLSVTQTVGQNNQFNVSSGAIYINGLFAQLENPSGAIALALPASGTTTYTVAGYYDEVLDTPSTGYVLVDVNTRIEAVQSNPTRRFGACQIVAFSGSAPSSLASGYVILATITCGTSGITSVSTTTRQTATAGVAASISDSATNNQTSLQASSVAQAGKLLALTSQKAIVLNDGNIQAASGLFTGSLTVQGQLNVPSGSTIQTSSVSANKLILNSNQTSGSPLLLDSGIDVDRGGLPAASLYWNDSNSSGAGGYWRFTQGGLTIVTGGITISAGNFTAVAGSFSDTLTVTNGSTQGVLFGTAAAGTRAYSSASSYDTLDLSTALTGLTASSGITITGSGHSRTIQNTGVLSAAGSGAITVSTTNQAATVSVATATSGALGVVKIGTGLSVDGTGNVTNADAGSAQKIFKNIASSDGTTQFSAISNSDSVRFAAGTGTQVSFTPATNTVTITNTGAQSVAAGTGISVANSSGAYTVTNTGLLSATNGGGMTVTTSSGAVTITNADKGSSQNIFKNIADSSGAVKFSAASNTDTIRFAGGGASTVSFDGTTKTVTITSTDTQPTYSSTATDIKALGTQNAGALSTAARADHVHPTTGLALTGSSNTFSANQQVNGLFGINIAPQYGLHMLGGGFAIQGLDITQAGTPTTTIIGTTGTASYTYYVVAVDAAGNTTLPSPGKTVASAPNTLSTSNYVQISWTPVTGAAEYYVLKGDTGHRLAIVTGTTYNDQGAATVAYATGDHNATSDIATDGYVGCDQLQANSVLENGTLLVNKYAPKPAFTTVAEATPGSLSAGSSTFSSNYDLGTTVGNKYLVQVCLSGYTNNSQAGNVHAGICLGNAVNPATPNYNGTVYCDGNSAHDFTVVSQAIVTTSASVRYLRAYVSSANNLLSAIFYNTQPWLIITQIPG